MSDRGNDKTPDEVTPDADDALGSLGISRRRLAYVAPVILLSRRMIYRAAGCGKDHPRLRSCRSAPSGS